MNYNDYQQRVHLLNWIKAQSHNFNPSVKLHSLEDIPSCHLLPWLMNKIHPTFFSSISGKEYHHQLFFSMLEKYIIEVEDLKIQKVYRQLILDSQKVEDLLKLILFLIMRHEQKQEFVANILELEEQTQIYLMNQLKLVQSQLDNNIEIKEIFSKIEELEDENDSLKERIKEIHKKQHTAKHCKQLISEENSRLVEENRVHDREKNEIMEDIGSHQSKDYLATYKDIENERIELIYSQKDIEGENNVLREEKLEMEDKIEEDRCITLHLNEEIMRYRTALQEVKEEGKRSFVKSRKADKENLNLSCSLSVIPCSKMIKSVDVDTTMNSYKNLTILEEGENEPLSCSIMQHNQTLQSKLQEMHSKITRLNQEIVEAKEEKDVLARGNRRKQKTIYLAEREFNSFKLNYEFTISG